jgi:hypothetical protein
MKSWPNLSVIVGVNEGGVRYGRVALLGDRAISDFSRHCLTQQTIVSVPKFFRAGLGGISKVIYFRRRDGLSGWAIAVPGEPPSLREISAALKLFSLGRVRSPLLKTEKLFDRGLFRLLAFLKRRRRNSKGIPVVHARKIPRLQQRPWRRLWSQPARLKMRATTDPVILPSVTGGHE